MATRIKKKNLTKADPDVVLNPLAKIMRTMLMPLLVMVTVTAVIVIITGV